MPASPALSLARVEIVSVLPASLALAAGVAIAITGGCVSTSAALATVSVTAALVPALPAASTAVAVSVTAPLATRVESQLKP